MLADFGRVDHATLRCSAGSGEVRIDGADLALGPLVELLMFRRKSLDPSVQLRVEGGEINLSKALRLLPAGTHWAWAKCDQIGVLRLPHSEGADSDEDVKHAFLLELRKRLDDESVAAPSAQAIVGATGEMVDNIWQHAGPGQDAIAAFQIQAKSLWISIGDCGRGMLATYATHDDVKTTHDALRAAVREHRSSTRQPGRGQGFRKLLDVLSSMDASLRVRTGDASLETEGLALDGKWTFREQVLLVGCVVSAHLKW